MDIRRAERRDVETIGDIYNQAVLATTATYDLDPQTLDHQRAWFDEHERGGFPIFVAEDASQVVGWSALSPYRSRPGYRFTVEDSIYVRDGRRGQGIGSRLLPPLIDAARQLGMHCIVAVIDSEGEPSLRLHARCGFQEVGRLHQAGFKFDRWLDVVHMELLLTN